MGMPHVEKGGGLLAPYDVLIWAGGHLEARQLLKNVQERVHLRQWQVWNVFRCLAH